MMMQGIFSSVDVVGFVLRSVYFFTCQAQRQILCIYYEAPPSGVLPLLECILSLERLDPVKLLDVVVASPRIMGCLLKGRDEWHGKGRVGKAFGQVGGVILMYRDVQSSCLASSLERCHFSFYLSLSISSFPALLQMLCYGSLGSPKT